MTFINSKQLEHRAYCCELHAAFALLELGQKDLTGDGCPQEVASDWIVNMAARSLARQPITAMGQDDSDGEVDRILGS